MSDYPGPGLPPPQPETPPAPPAPAYIGAKKGYQGRFLATYSVLGVAAAAATIGLIAITLHHNSTPNTVWSSWAPQKSNPTSMISEIADHIGSTYRRSRGGAQLTAVVPSKPVFAASGAEVPLALLVVRQHPGSTLGQQELATTNTAMFSLCGLGANCSISTGKATTTRGQLVRREALELALYTFKYVPSITSVMAFVPPRPLAKTAKTAPPPNVLFYTKSALTQELVLPLRTTLRYSTPPLPTVEDTAEAAKIAEGQYYSADEVEQLPGTNSAYLVLDPVANPS